jgi:hypothetical protein
MTINLRYTEPILKKAILYYMQREYLKKCLWLFVLAALVLATDFLVDNAWYRAFTVVPVLVLPTLFLCGYWLRIKDSLKKFALLDDGRVTLTLNESSVSTESEVGKSEVKWKMFAELWEFLSAYLLLFTNRHFLTLPKDQTPPEAVAFIREHLKPGGA